MDGLKEDKIFENQSSAFLKGEADKWYERNKSVASKEEHYDTASIKRVLLPFKQNIGDILEIGCSSGAKLEQLCDFFDASGKGVDPSALAVKEGNEFLSQQGKNISLQVATACALPFESNKFDLVYFGFCLYLIEPDSLYRAIAEADRVLKKGGFLIVHDFDPGKRYKREYHHKPGLFSYKNAYSELFTAAGHYYLVSKESFSHEGLSSFSINRDNRVSVCILYKELEPY